jgi:hypothetical protein
MHFEGFWYALMAIRFHGEIISQALEGFCCVEWPPLFKQQTTSGLKKDFSLFDGHHLSSNKQLVDLHFPLSLIFWAHQSYKHQGTITTCSSPNVTFNIFDVNMLKITLGDEFVV